jgi:hypothetical protein
MTTTRWQPTHERIIIGPRAWVCRPAAARNDESPECVSIAISNHRRCVGSHLLVRVKKEERMVPKHFRLASLPMVNDAPQRSIHSRHLSRHRAPIVGVWKGAELLVPELGAFIRGVYAASQTRPPSGRGHMAHGKVNRMPNLKTRAFFARNCCMENYCMRMQKFSANLWNARYMKNGLLADSGWASSTESARSVNISIS